PRNPHVYFEYNWTAPRPTLTAYAFDGPMGPNTILNRTLLDDAPDPRGKSFDQLDPSWRKTVTVLNGAGEEMYTAGQIEANRWVVSGWKERDVRGRIVLVADPFYASGAEPPTTRPASGLSLQTIAYDALGRLSVETAA